MNKFCRSWKRKSHLALFIYSVKVKIATCATAGCKMILAFQLQQPLRLCTRCDGPEGAVEYAVGVSDGKSHSIGAAKTL